MPVVWIRCESAKAESTAITSSDVPTASGIGNRNANTSAGTITNPPPTPKKPVRNPTAVPSDDDPEHSVHRSGGRRLDGDYTDTATAAALSRRCRHRLPCLAPHSPGSDDHQTGEGEQQHIGIDRLVQMRADQGTTDTDPTEHQAAPHSDTTGAKVGEHAEERGEAHHEQRGGRGRLRPLSGAIDQSGHGENGTAPAQRAEGHSDEKAQR